MVSTNRQISHHPIQQYHQFRPLAYSSMDSLLGVGTGRQFIGTAAILLHAVVWFLTGTLGVMISHFCTQMCTMACSDNGKAAATPVPIHPTTPTPTSPPPIRPTSSHHSPTTQATSQCRVAVAAARRRRAWRRRRWRRGGGGGLSGGSGGKEGGGRGGQGLGSGDGCGEEEEEGVLAVVTKRKRAWQQSR